MEYGYKRLIKNNFEDTEKELRDSLAKQGFGVITEIDVKNTFKNKLNKDFKKYKILGAFESNIAHNALSMDEQIGLLLPCNLVIWENEDEAFIVATIDPRAQLSIAGIDKLVKHSEKINNKLKMAVNKI